MKSACDIFSFGVVLTELLTGKVQNYEISSTKSVFLTFSREYIKKKPPRSLTNDVDTLSGYCDVSNLQTFVNDVAELALDCMSPDIEDRPTGYYKVMNRLKIILNHVHSGKFNTTTSSPENPLIMSTVILRMMKCYVNDAGRIRSIWIMLYLLHVCYC